MEQPTRHRQKAPRLVCLRPYRQWELQLLLQLLYKVPRARSLAGKKPLYRLLLLTVGRREAVGVVPGPLEGLDTLRRPPRQSDRPRLANMPQVVVLPPEPNELYRFVAWV